jgi:hemoglobin
LPFSLTESLTFALDVRNPQRLEASWTNDQPSHKISNLHLRFMHLGSSNTVSRFKLLRQTSSDQACCIESKRLSSLLRTNVANTKAINHSTRNKTFGSTTRISDSVTTQASKMLTSSISPQSKPQVSKPKRTLLDRLGGVPALRAAVAEFYNRLLADPALAIMFVDVPMPLLRTHQFMFLKTAFTSIPDNFDVYNHILQKHMRLFFDKGLDETHFDLVATHFVQTLQHLGISAELVNEVVGIVVPLRGAFAEGAEINVARYFV